MGVTVWSGSGVERCGQPARLFVPAVFPVMNLTFSIAIVCAFTTPTNQHLVGLLVTAGTRRHDCDYGFCDLERKKFYVLNIRNKSPTIETKQQKTKKT